MQQSVCLEHLVPRNPWPGFAQRNNVDQFLVDNCSLRRRGRMAQIVHPHNTQDPFLPSNPYEQEFSSLCFPLLQTRQTAVIKCVNTATFDNLNNALAGRCSSTSSLILHRDRNILPEAFSSSTDSGTFAKSANSHSAEKPGCAALTKPRPFSCIPILFT
jgi:hypothetical protein